MSGQHDKSGKSTGKRGEFFLEIHVVDNNVEKAIRVLKRKLQQEGLFREMKQRKFYEKPSVKKKRKEKEAQRRLRKKMRMMRQD
jgi:small subunit ribosomal protein S21